MTPARPYDPRKWQSTCLVQPTGGGTPIHDHAYQFDGNSNRTQIVADPDVAMPPANPKTVLTYNAVNELLTTSVYNGQGVQQDISNWKYDAAGNQTGNTGYPHLTPPSPPLSITYNQHNQMTSITDVYQNAVAMTYTGPGQSQRTSANWSNVPNPTDPTKPAEFGFTTYANSALGLMSEADTTGTTYYTRDPAGLPISERTPSGTYYYIVDGQGEVVVIVDGSGAVVVLYDPCPTGNPAGNGYQKPGTQLSSHNFVQYLAATGGVTDWGTHMVKVASYTSTDGTGDTQRNCYDPTNRLQTSCLLPIPFCPFGSCYVGLGILKALCDAGIYCSPYESTGGSSRLRNTNLAQDVATATGGTLETEDSGLGYVITIPYKSGRPIVVRIMDQGGGRTDYWRISIPGKQTFDVSGNPSSDRAATHIPITASTLSDIINVVNKIKSSS